MQSYYNIEPTPIKVNVDSMNKATDKYNKEISEFMAGYQRGGDNENKSNSQPGGGSGESLGEREGDNSGAKPKN